MARLATIAGRRLARLLPLTFGDSLSFHLNLSWPESESGRRSADPTSKASPAAVSIARRDGKRDRQNRLAACWYSLAALVVFWWTATAAVGQGQYETFELEDRFTTPNVEKSLERAYKSLTMARDLGSMSDRERSMAAFYLNRYVPWKLTQPQNLSQIGPTIDELLDRLTRAQKMGSPGSPAMLRYTFDGFKKIAEGNYMPASRIAATLALARLEAKPFDLTTSSLPVPYPQSLPVLMQLYANAEGTTPDGVVAAALQGIERFVRYGFSTIPPDGRRQIGTAMLELLDSPPPEGRSSKAHAYLQRTAVDILQMLMPNDDKNLASRLIAMSTADDRPNLIALYSTAKLGGFRNGVRGAVNDPSPVLAAWSKRAYEAIDNEMRRLAAMTKPQPAQGQPAPPESFLGRRDEGGNERERQSPMGRGGAAIAEREAERMAMQEARLAQLNAMMGGGMGEMGAMEGLLGMEDPSQPVTAAPEVKMSRRHLNHVLQQIYEGTTGSASGEVSGQPAGLIVAVPDAQRQKVQQWLEAVRPVVEAINDASVGDRERWIAVLEAQRLNLARLAGIEMETPEETTEESPLEFSNGLPPVFGATGF